MRYLALLRGINVSGHKKIKMADLRALFEALSFKQVQTYIQSGNVIFESDAQNVTNLKVIIETAILQRFEFQVPIELRTLEELTQVVRDCPFPALDLQKDGTQVLVTFLADRPAATSVNNLKACVIAPEKLVVSGSEVYLYCPNGYGKSKLSNTFLETKLGVAATTRNWKSVNALWTLMTD